ncbi:MAG TPA: hypothetical protein VK581_13535, partial [Chthoniobacterales bacterium]|nr:hypothetical protein [Chthoniobacterales bacterium]
WLPAWLDLVATSASASLLCHARKFMKNEADQPPCQVGTNEAQAARDEDPRSFELVFHKLPGMTK